jgi:hypothetical protein
MNREIWRDIPDYEGLYQVSNLGRIKTLARETYTLSGRLLYRRKEKYRTIVHDTKGYPMIILCKNSISKTYKIHRLVAKEFIPNPKNKPQINHKDGNKKNNYYKNLEWCTNSENQLHAFSTGLQKSPRGPIGMLGKLNSKSKCILQFTQSGELIDEYWGAKEACRKTGVDYRSIHKVCSKKYTSKTAGGFIWKFKNEQID